MLERILNPYLEAPVRKASETLEKAGVTSVQLTLGLIGCASLSILATALHGSSLAVFLIITFAGLILVKQNMGLSSKEDLEALDPLLPSLLYAILPLFLVISYNQSALIALILVISIIALHLAQQLHLKQDGMSTNKANNNDGPSHIACSTRCLSQFGDRLDKAVFFILVLMMPKSFALFAIIFSGLCWTSLAIGIAGTLKSLNLQDHLPQKQPASPRETTPSKLS